MDTNVTNWLLEGPEWLKYAVRLQLLDEEPDVQPVLKDASIAKIMGRLKDDNVGFPALQRGNASYSSAGNAYWDLFFLADIGLTADDLNLHEELEAVFKMQTSDGSFITGRSVQPNYYCMSAILISSLARMGYGDDPRLQKYIDVILDSQGMDGGWHCYNSRNEIMDIDACPMDNLNILMLLGQYEEYLTDPRFNGAIDLLMEHWLRRDTKWQLSGFGTGKRFASLKYPATKYGILRVMDVISLFPYAHGSNGFKNMLKFVREKASDGKYTPESAERAYAGFDFGQTTEPSRWLTFIINRVEKRAGE